MSLFLEGGPAIPHYEGFPMSTFTVMEPPPEQVETHSSYRKRTQEENAHTQEIVIAMAHDVKRDGGYILVSELETRSLFSRVKLSGKRMLEVGCGTLPVTMAIPAHDQPRLFIASDV